MEYNDLDLSFMANIINKHLTKDQKIMLNKIKQSNKVLDLLQTLKDHDFELYITDSAPNGTNDLLITKDSEIIDCLDEFTFGLSAINIDKEYQNVIHAYNNNIGYLSDYKPDDDQTRDELDVYLTYVKLYSPYVIADKTAISPTKNIGDIVIKLNNFIDKYCKD